MSKPMPKPIAESSDEPIDRLMHPELPEGWSTVGGWRGGTVSSLALLVPDPGKAPVVLAATGAGIFRSTDRGRTWMRSSAGLDDAAFATVAAVPGSQERSAIVFAGTENGRLYRSDDGGDRWVEVESWAGLGTANAIVPSPNFGDDASVFVATSGGVMRSLDGARSWESSTFGLIDLDVLCLACAPAGSRQGLMWAGTAAGGLYRSRNAALAWRESGLGLPDAPVQCIAVSPYFGDDATLWVGLEGHGVYQSVDGGETWSRRAQGLEEASVNALVVVTAPGVGAGSSALSMVAATDRGLYFSTDGGVHWSPAESGDFAVLDLLALPDGVVLGATYIDGVIRSSGSLAEWVVANDGLAAHAPPLVATNGANAMVMLDRDGAAAISVDGGGTWVDVPGDAGGGSFSALAIGPSGDEFFLAGEEGIVRLSPRDGSVRTYSLPSGAEEALHLMAVARAAGQEQPTLAAASANGPVYMLSKLDGSWNEIPSPAPTETIFDVNLWAVNGRGVELTAVTGWREPRGYYQFNVWAWEPGAVTWRPLASLASDIPSVLLRVAERESGIVRFLATQNRLIVLSPGAEGEDVQVAQHFFEENARITALVCSPRFASDSTVYVALRQGLYRSTDGGTQWDAIPVPERMPPIVSMELDMALNSALNSVLNSAATMTVVVIGGDVLRVRLPD